LFFYHCGAARYGNRYDAAATVFHARAGIYTLYPRVYLHMQPIAKKGGSKPFSIISRFLKKFRVFGSDKLAYFYGHTIHNLNLLILVTRKVFKKYLFNLPQVSALSHKVRSMRHFGKQMRPMVLEVFIDVFIFVKAKIFAGNFHGYHFTIRQFWRKSAGSQFMKFRKVFIKVINQNINRDDKIYKSHICPPWLVKDFISFIAKEGILFT